MKRDGLSKDGTLILILILLTLWVRLSTQMIVHTGVDERDYWYAAKALTQGYGYPELTHRTVRWSIILPTAALQLLFGTHPNVYYLGPLLNALVQTILMYFLGKEIRNRTTGVLAALLLLFFPYQIRAASQVRPEIYSITYIALCLYLLVRHIKSGGSLAYLAASSLALFLAYLAKITNLFFLPGIFAALLLYGPRKRIRACFAYGGLLLGLYLAETLLYRAATPYPLGQLSIISSHHLSSGYAAPLSGFLDLFSRYSPENLDAYWSLSFLLFAATAPLVFFRSAGKPARLLVVTALSFFFFITFTVTSLDPLLPAEDFINRYFCAVLPPVLTVLALGMDQAACRFYPKRIGIQRALGAAALLLGLGLSMLFSLPGLPERHRQYAHTPLRPQDHPYALTDRYYREIRSAWDAGIFFAAPDTVGGDNALMTAAHFFIDGPAPEARLLSADGLTVRMISKDGSAGSATFMAPIRNPFRIAEFPVNALGRIDSDHFPK